MSSLADHLRRAGALHAEGEFTLDLEQADSKLARFQFREEHEFLYHMVGGLYRVGATAVGVRHATGALTLSLDLPVPDEMPGQLGQHLLQEFSPWRRLAAAVQAAMAHDPGRFEWVGAGTEQHYDYLHQQAKRWKKVRLREIRLVGLAKPLVEKALDELEARALHNRRNLSINGRSLPMNSEQLTAVAGQRAFFHCQPGAALARIDIVVDGMLTEPKRPDLHFPWHGVVYWDTTELRMDASLAAVNEDEVYGAFLEALPQTFGRCLPALMNRPDDPEVRAFLFDWMRLPMPAWLHPHHRRLLELSFFADQRGRRWSLSQLLDRPEPTYFSAAPSVVDLDLDEVILYAPAASEQQCLAYYLGDRLREATPRILRELQRRTNLARWQARPLTPLELPARNWLAQHRDEHCVIGIGDDWRRPGGEVVLLHQGRVLANRTIDLEEMSFLVVAEVAENQIGPVFNDLSEEAWEELKSGWLAQLEKLVAEHLASGEGQMRRHLLAHLCGLDHPEDSYFSSTVLFRDWRGQLYSLDSLRQAKGSNCPVGYVWPECQPDDYPPAFLPRGIYIQANPSEAACLRKVRDLSARDFNLVLADLKQAGAEASPSPLDQSWAVSWEGDDYRATLQITPDWGVGTVAPVIRGVPIDTQELRSEIGFRALVFNDTFKLQVRTANERLGAGRYTLAMNAPWRHCQEDLLKHVAESARLRLQSELAGPWQDWALQAVLRGLARDYPQLQALVSWPAHPEPVTLERMLAAESIVWRSPGGQSSPGEYLAAHPQVEFLLSLPASQQQTLSTFYGGRWECVDAWFEKNERMREFLSRPTQPLGAEVVWNQAEAREPLQGLLSLVPAPYEDGELQWLYQGRLVQRSAVLPPCFLAQVSSEQLEMGEDFAHLEPEERLTELMEPLREQLAALLLEWLREPHLGMIAQAGRLWRAWRTMGPEIEAALRARPWFYTNLGRFSWDELMQKRPLYRLPERRYDHLENMLIVFDFLSPVEILNELMAEHPEAFGHEATQLFLEDRARFQRHQACLRSQAERLAGHRYRGSLTPPLTGELALLTGSVKDCWLVHEDRAVPIHNLPAGFAGYLESSEARLERLGEQEAAVLPPALVQAVGADMLPLLLRRIQGGQLELSETQIIAEFCLCSLPPDPDAEAPWSALWQASWMPCADGTRVSLRQLALEGREQGRLLYWDRKYPLSGIPTLTPLLTTPLLLEVVQRFTGVPCELNKPLLYRDVAELAAAPLRNLRGALEGLGRWVKSRPASGMVQAMRGMLTRPREVEQETRCEQQGAALLAALRRQASLMLAGPAREETLRSLDRASWRAEGQGRLWTLREDGQLFLHSSHPRLAPYLGAEEPPPPVTLSLLLGLVSLINARSLPFSDDMEREFLQSLTVSLVETYRDVIA